MSSTSIYTPSNTITKYENFQPTRLYIKKHSKTGLLYFGKSIREDVEQYRGSGVRWNNHLEVHGKYQVETIWVSDWFTDPHDIEEFALFFSEEHDIVNNDAWANLIPEDGLSGGRMTDEIIKSAKEKEMQTKSTNEWASTVLLERNRKDSETKLNPLWKETIGAAAMRKQLETKSNPEWQETIGKEARRKQKETTNDPEWRLNQSNIIKQVRNDPVWKETVGKEANRKLIETLRDTEWKETIGKEAILKRKETISDPSWKENNTVECEFCNKKVDKANYTKWHGNRCKLNPNRNNDDIVTCTHCHKTMNKIKIKKHESICCKG